MIMKQRINVAELLKDCPKGMELDCTMFDNVTFVRVNNNRQFPIEIVVGGLHSKYLTKEGCFHDNTLLLEAKCVIFPKGKTTWEGFQRPFKDGDVLVDKYNNIGIFLEYVNTYWRSYIYLGCDGELRGFHTGGSHGQTDTRLATEEEKQKIFDAIKANGYKWNEETKTLEKLIEPKFKVGDRIKKNKDYISGVITNIDDGFYRVEYIDGNVAYINSKFQDDYELAPNKFDINTLIPFESKVLVKSSYGDKWRPAIYGFASNSDKYRYYIVGGVYWEQCIPYEGNEHLLGATDDCDDYYKTWEE